MALSYREQIVLAHQLGAKYEMGYWKFPTEEAKQLFRRRVSGVEWTQQQREAADAALKAQRECWACNGTKIVTTSSNGSGLIETPCAGCIDMEPGAK